ncbi:MAG: L-rhamnose mutarotase [Muribaculaceae bacterium]|jgi:L-rhamnose mutarotase|nr:L-rhamnose mutarotase [Muribaculaceae bacterium]
MQRFVLTLDLVDDPGLIERYLEAHRNIWPEIPAGIREVGITGMDIYRDGNRLVMIMQMPDSIDRDAAMERLATLPRQAEWEEFVGQFQQCDPGSTSAGKWRQMNRIFELPSPHNTSNNNNNDDHGK